MKIKSKLECISEPSTSGTHDQSGKYLIILYLYVLDYYYYYIMQNKTQ